MCTSYKEHDDKVFKMQFSFIKDKKQITINANYYLLKKKTKKTENVLEVLYTPVLCLCLIQLFFEKFL